jgi:histidine triad (HIT) family protein
MYDENNIFAKIIRKEIPAKILFEDKYAIAFNDIAPVAPIHILIIPKIECVDYEDFITKASLEGLRGYFLAIKQIASQMNIADYRLVNNNGALAGQSVFHFHMHLLAGTAEPLPMC